MSAPTTLDRMWAAFRALVRAELEEVGYLGLYAYTVRGATLGYVDGEPLSTTLGLPSVHRVPLLPALGGETARATVGATCYIAFVDGDPTRPVCVSLSAIEELRIADGSAFAARVGDSVSVNVSVPSTPFTGTATGTITGGSSKVKVGG